MKNVVCIAAALMCAMSISAQDAAMENEYSEDFLEPVEKPSVEVLVTYSDSLHNLFIGDRSYDFSCIIMPSLMKESCLAYDKEAGELVYQVAKDVVWGVVNKGTDKELSAEKYTLQVSEPIGTGLSVLVMLATESSKLYKPQEGIAGLDGTTYEFSHSNGIVAKCWSPRNGNCLQLVDMMQSVCKLVEENNSDELTRLLPSVYGLINGFLQVMPGRTLE